MTLHHDAGFGSVHRTRRSDWPFLRKDRLVFFSFSGSKLPGYILPIVPPLALLIGKELVQPSTLVYRVAVFMEAGAMVFIGVAFGFFGNTLNVDPHVSGTLILVITFVMGA